MALRAVLWDVDGTLLESRLSIRNTMNTVLAERGLGTFTRAELDLQIGRPLRDILAEKCKDASVVEAMTHRYREVYNESGWTTAHIFAGLEELVRKLKGDGWLQGVVTSKGQRETELLLLDMGLSGVFDVVVGDNDSRPLKPDPAPVRDACAQLQVKPGEAVMVGDTRFDVEAGLGAGAHVIGVLWGIQDEPMLRAAGATVLVDDVDALAEAIERIR